MYSIGNLEVVTCKLEPINPATRFRSSSVKVSKEILLQKFITAKL